MTRERVVCVTWFDTMGRSQWLDRATHRAGKAARVDSVGFLMRSDKNEVVVSQSLVKANDTADHSISIPRGCVQKIRTLASVEVP